MSSHKGHMEGWALGQQPRELTPTASPHHYLGAEMRAWREQRGLSLAKLGKKIAFTPSYMARVERGEQAASADLVTAYDHALNAGGSLVRIYRHITEGDNPQQIARAHVSYPEPHVSNDHAPLADDSGIQALSSEEEGVAIPARTDDGRIIFVSLSRRALFGALGSVAGLVIPNESPAASTRRPPVGISPINPIEHLEATWKVLVDNDNLFGPHRVIPIAQRQIAAIKAMREDTRGSDRRRLLQLQTQYSELCGWFHQDSGDFRASQHWTREALETSHMAADPELTTYILVRSSQIAGDMRDPGETVDVAEAAERMATPGSRLAAVAALFGAHGHALRGEEAECARAYDRAHELYARMDPDPASPWGVWLDDSFIEVHRARSLAQLGHHQAAAEGYRAAVRRLPAEFHRDRGVYLAREAVAHAGAGDAEQAAAVGLQALRIGLETGSARITGELVHLDGMLSGWRTVPGVADFKAAMLDSVPREV